MLLPAVPRAKSQSKKSDRIHSDRYQSGRSGRELKTTYLGSLPHALICRNYRQTMVVRHELTTAFTVRLIRYR